MKKTVSVVALACCIGLTAPAMGQTKPAAAPAGPVKIGLVDMTRVFNGYQKFADLRAALQADVKNTMGEGNQLKAQMEKIKEELKLLKPGSEEYIKREQDFAQIGSDLNAKGQLAKVQLQRKEAEIFQTIYGEATSVIKLYAEHFKYSMVMRFNSAEIDPEKPNTIVNGLNKLVIYHRPQDDITDAVIDYLNRKYTPAKPAVPKTATPGGPARQ